MSFEVNASSLSLSLSFSLSISLSYIIMLVFVCVLGSESSVCMSIDVCVCEKERKGERVREREREEFLFALQICSTPLLFSGSSVNNLQLPVFALVPGSVEWIGVCIVCMLYTTCIHKVHNTTNIRKNVCSDSIVLNTCTTLW